MEIYINQEVMFYNHPCIATGLKEEAEMGNRSRHGSGASSTGERTEPPELPPSMGQTLDIIQKRLKEKRKEMQRPEDIEVCINFRDFVTENFYKTHFIYCYTNTMRITLNI